MSNQSHYQQLGITEDASFEEIQAAKERLKQKNSNDQKVIENIEAAYDAILMDRLRLRQEGKIKVPERIRFPERQQKRQLKV
jgi:DnaJ-class molecular chaperone with C-terminal Zn finger domain